MTFGHRALKHLVLVVLLLSAAVAFADRGVFNAKMQPNETFVSTPINVAVTAEIGADAVNPVILSSVVLYETNAAGSPVAQVGRLYDDGTHGDVLAADTIFTMILTVNEPNPRTRYFRISAAYTGVRNRYLSPVFTVTVYPQMPALLMPAAEAAIEGLQNAFLANVPLIGVNAARNTALTQALGNPNIGPGNANLNGPVLSLMYVYTDPGTGYVFRIPGICILDDPANPTDGAGRSTPTNLPASYKTPGNDNLLLFGPGYNAPDPQNAIMDHAAAQFNNPEYMTFNPNPPSITSGANASLEVVKQWGSYGTVIIHTHGGLWDLNGTQQVVLVSGTPASWWNQLTYIFDLLANRIGVAGDGRFVFYPSFITKYVGGMNDTFIYLGACESLQNDTMWNALKAKGAKVAFGWSQTVNRGFNADTFAALIDPMLPKSNPPDPLSALDAFNNVAVKVDPFAGFNATLTMRTASPEWNNTYFVGGGIVNGGFETGDWTGWTHGGALSTGENFQLIVGSHTHSGLSAAALGRWDSAFIGYNPALEPYGYEWFYQDFTVPGNVTTLSFWWWQETYDTAAWDWLDAYIMDTGGQVLQTLVSSGGKPGTNYGPYWTTAGWQFVSADVTAYRNQKIRIYFDQRLDGYGDQTRSYVDDVKLQ